MYTKEDVIKGLQDPYAVGREFKRQWRKARSYFPHDVGVQGSYRMGNVGDLAIGEIFKIYLSERGYKVKLFHKNITRSSARIRVLGGGGVLHDWYGVDHLHDRLKFIEDGGVIIGVGVPGFKSEESKNLIEQKLTNVELVTVRDEWSRNRLSKVYDGEINVTACPALLHSDPEVDSNGRTGVNFRPWFHLEPDVMSYYFDYPTNLNYKQAHNQYIDNAQRICESVKNPLFIPFHKKDEKFAQKYLDVDIIPFTFDVEKTLKQVSSVERMVAMRYHSLVFAIICDKPTIALSYEPKVGCLADRVGIPHVAPHQTAELDFDPVINKDKVREAATANFTLLESHFD